MPLDEPKLTYTNLFDVVINGMPVPASVNRNLGACWIECSMNLPTAFHLKFTDNYQDMLKENKAQFYLGAKVQVYVTVDGVKGSSPLVTGEITGIETEYDGGVPSLVIRGYDHAVKMMRRRRTQIYEDRTATEIVTTLAGEDGVLIGTTEQSPTRYKMITQANISDWQFANQLAYQNGMFADFDNKGALRFRKLPRVKEPVNRDWPELPTILKLGVNVHHCRIGVTSADQASSVTVRGWDMELDKPLPYTTDEKLDYPGRAILANPRTSLAAVKLHPYVETDTPYGDGSLPEVTAAAKALAEDIDSVFAELEAWVFGNPGLVAGQTVQLAGAGEDYDGLYTVTAARHEFGGGGRYMTLVTVTGRQVRSPYGLASGASGPRSRISGVVNAIVVDINDLEKKGRVRVRFPWLDDKYVSRWARIVQFGGSGGGGVINPAVDDEVLVAFDRGDIDYPYVLGGLYGHLVNKPSPHDTDLVTAGHVNRLSLVSRAGHRLELLDAAGEAPKHGVRLQSGNKALTVFLDEIKTEIQIDSTGKVSITGKDNVSITSSGAVSVEAPSVSIKAPKITIEGDVTVTGAVNINGLLTNKGDVSIIGGLNSLGDAVFTGDVDVIGILKEDGVPVMP